MSKSLAAVAVIAALTTSACVQNMPRTDYASADDAKQARPGYYEEIRSPVSLLGSRPGDCEVR